MWALAKMLRLDRDILKKKAMVGDTAGDAEKMD